MRGIILTAAAAAILMVGPGCRNNQYDQAYYQGAPRVNLYPLTSPPAGSVQPVRGYGPTRVSNTQDYYGQTTYVDTAPGYATTTQAVYPNPGYYNPGGTTGTYPAGYTVPATAYTGYAVSQDPFPAGTIGASMGAGVVANPYGGGFCRVEDIRPGMNPVVPIQDPPVVIDNNITVGGAPAPVYAAPQPTYAQPTYTQPTTMTTSYAPGMAGTAPASYATAGYATGAPAPGGMAQGPARLSANVVSTTGPGVYDSGPVPYCGPGVACPPDPRVDTSMYGGTTVINDAMLGAPSTFGLPAGGQPAGNAGGYVGGAYPWATGTIPAQQNSARATINTGMGDGVAGDVRVGGMRLVPARDVPPAYRPSDAGPSQWFEIIRPGNGPLRIGRVSASCVCVGVRVPKREVGAGERALVEVRTLTRPVGGEVTYGVFVGIEEPERMMLDADVVIR